MRLPRLFGISLALAGVISPFAAADGLPVVGETRAAELTAPGGFARYATVEEGGGTVVLRLEREGGRVFASGYLPGKFTIPVVAYDGSPAGISPDGGTLVLIRPRATFPRARTTFAILDGWNLRVRSVTTLRGDFSFDAVSPGGSTLYFIEYLSPDDQTEYAVRAFDTRAGELVREPIVDRTEPDEDMGGNPLSRATSPDGRWAYTLYDGAGSAPFVHALDTVRREAHCIDLDSLAGRGDLPDLRLRIGNGSLAVLSATGRVAVIDTASFQVVKAGHGSSAGKNGPWAAIGVLVALLAATGVALIVRRRRRLSPV
jgi:DNA-binding beta-propeller fold protein YncE